MLTRVCASILAAAMAASTAVDAAARDGAEQPAKARWFSEVGVSFDAGATFNERALGREWEVGFGLGPSVRLGVFRYTLHRVFLGIGYLHLMPDEESGTEQVRVRTSLERFDAVAGYDVCWRFLAGGLHVGTALVLVKSEQSLYEVSYTVVESQYLEFERGEEIDGSDGLGVQAGFLTGLSFGIDFVGLFLKNSDAILELRIRGDYVRRGERDDFLAGGMLVFWPTGLIGI